MNLEDKSFVLVDRTIAANGPSMGLGVVTMMSGLFSIFIGIGMAEPLGYLFGVLLFFISALLIFTIDCIAVNKTDNELYLYRDYFFKITNMYSLTNYEAVCVYYQIDAPRNSRRSWNTTQLKTFTVILLSKNNEKLILKETRTINLARELQHKIAGQTGLKLIKEPIREK